MLPWEQHFAFQGILSQFEAGYFTLVSPKLMGEDECLGF